VDNENAARPVLLDWRGRLASTLLGSSVAGGLSINILSGDYRWRTVFVALSAGTLLATSGWLHRRAASAIARWSIRALLVLALVAVLLAQLGSALVRPWSSVIAAALTVAAVLVPRGHEAAIRMLLGAATTGIGLTSVIIAAGCLLIKDQPGMLNAYGVVLMAVGAAGVALGQASLRGSQYLGNGIIGLGAALGLEGLVLMAGGPRLPGLGLAVGGMATALFGMGWTRKQYNFYGLGLLGIGAASLVISFAQLSGGYVVYGLIFLSHGTLVAVSGFGLLLGNVDLFQVAQVGGGLANAALGTAVLSGGKALYGIALLGVAAGAIVSNLNSLRRGHLGQRIILWWQSFSAEPTMRS
jgi:hypothetical protein